MLNCPETFQTRNPQKGQDSYVMFPIVEISDGEQDWETTLPAVTLAYNAANHSSTGCSPARGFLGREVDIPHLSILPKLNPEKNVNLAI